MRGRVVSDRRPDMDGGFNRSSLWKIRPGSGSRAATALPGAAVTQLGAQVIGQGVADDPAGGDAGPEHPRYSQPSQVPMSVMSPHQRELTFEASAVKSRPESCLHGRPRAACGAAPRKYLRDSVRSR